MQQFKFASWAAMEALRMAVNFGYPVNEVSVTCDLETRSARDPRSEQVGVMRLSIPTPRHHETMESYSRDIIRPLLLSQHRTVLGFECLDGMSPMVGAE